MMRKGKGILDQSLWLGLGLAVILLSLTGSSLRGWVQAAGLWVHIAWISVVMLLCLSVLGQYLLYLHRVKNRALLSVALLVLLGLILFFVDNEVERLHFFLFGLFGVYSARLFVLPWSLVAMASLGAGDELLQYYLPSRVGDLRDVAFNLFAGLMGILFYFQLQRRG